MVVIKGCIFSIKCLNQFTLSAAIELNEKNLKEKKDTKKRF